MNISQGLKHKNKLVKELVKLNDKLRQSNSWTEPNKPVYNSEEVLDQIVAKTKELIDHKVKLSMATIKILPKIIEMNEIKSFISSSLKYINTNEGITRNYDKDVEHKCLINLEQKDILIQDYEDRIEVLQEEIDSYNAITKI